MLTDEMRAFLNAEATAKMRTWDVTSELLRRFDLTPDQASEALKEWIGEVYHKGAEALKERA